MGKRPDLSDDDWAELTAYLDGELDKKSARTMEAKLNANPTMRAEAEALQKTWQMLDYLPKPGPSTTFTSKTLERLSIVMPAAGQPKALPLRSSWAFGVGWAAAVLLAG